MLDKKADATQQRCHSFGERAQCMGAATTTRVAFTKALKPS